MHRITTTITATLLSLALGAVAQAEQATEPQTLVRINGFPITNLHFALFASQTGRNPTDAAGQISLLNELVNHFMVARSPQGEALAEDPEVVAALEVARARLIAQSFVRQQLESAPVSEAEIQALYQERHGGGPTLEFKARHILLASEEDARAVIAELDSGADFATLAGERSTGPTRTVGGDLGWFGAEQMVQPFAEATAALADGSYTKQPVQTRFGWHVILREDSREVPPPSLEGVREELVRELQQERVTDAINAIRDAAEIEIESVDTTN